jgi:hypothetical protein
MDDSLFDRVTQLFGASPTRRSALGVVVGAAIGGLTRLLAQPELESEARGKKKGKSKGKKKKKKKPQGERCGRVTCRLSESCCGGRCVDPFLCCDTTENCNGCQVCVDGLCKVDPSRNGAKCSDCMLCADGACEVPENEFCQDHQLCRPENGRCCEKCLDGLCCEIGEVCIKPGGSRPNSCCNTARGEPCGLNGDGTYRECCEPGVEECIQGTCELKIPCPGGRRSSQGLCCPDGRAPCPGKPGGDGPFCRPSQHEACCGDTSCNALQVCCDADQGICCTSGRCTEGRCCTGNREICAGKCCPFGQICCGSECCSEFGCVNGTCCEMDSCGAVDAANRICTGPNETCCFSGPDNSGFACPSVEWGGACAANGRCCPEGTFYEDSCDKCCADVRDRCEDCLPTFAGRF